MLTMARVGKVLIHPVQEAGIINLASEPTGVSIAENISVKVCCKPIPRCRVSVIRLQKPADLRWVYAGVIGGDADNDVELHIPSDSVIAPHQVIVCAWVDVYRRRIPYSVS